MNTEAIERIKGFCCEVTQEQWDELVRVADELGVKVGEWSKLTSFKCVRYARVVGAALCHRNHTMNYEVIPFPDFLDKLKGEEKWEPKAGEMVEVVTIAGWRRAEYMCNFKGRNWVWINESPCDYKHIRPLRPTITRAEAETLLNKRIID